MEDWITLSNGEKCNCGLKSPIFGKPVEGRIASNIILPNGTIYPPSEFLFISSVLDKLNTYKVKKFQVIQKKINEIEILLVIDDDLRDIGPSFEEISNKIKDVYLKKIGSDVNLKIKEVKEIKDDPTSGKPAPLVVSYVNQKDSCNLNNC
jgi:hypothetical protein